MKKRIKYICYYDRKDAKVKRNYTPAAVNKLDYIFEALNANDIGVDIISASGCTESGWTFAPLEKLQMGDNTLRLFFSFGMHDNPLFRVFSRWLVKIQFFLYLLFNIKRNEEVIVYHSLGYVKLLMKVQRLIKFRIIGEIEEIYQDVSSNFSKSICQAEYKFPDKCHKYIFPTQLLDEKLNKDGKPSLIIHGTYKVEPDSGEHFDDGKIHVVYSGTFDPNKGGAAAAVAAAEFLPENYHIHISGFGSKKDTAYIKKSIDKIAEKSACAITFEGLLKIDEYIRFLQKCQIGLCTQDPKSILNETSFPSKILSYMANGLKVVSISIEAIRRSAVGAYISYYQEQSPKNIAKAIINTTHKSMDVDMREVIEKLNEEFKSSIANLLNI